MRQKYIKLNSTLNVILFLIIIFCLNKYDCEVMKLYKNGVANYPPPGYDIEMYRYDGIKFPKNGFPPSTMEDMKTWKARPTDVFVVSYPKSGTTWIQEIVSAITHGGDIEKINKRHTVLRVPHFEYTAFRTVKDVNIPPLHKLIDKITSRRVIKSHLSGKMLPPEVLQKAKVVFVARNPKDVAVSYFYFHKYFPGLTNYESWDEYLNDFMTGNLAFGSWWEQYLDFWERRNEPNVLFLKYEDMKRDLKASVKATAKFLGYHFSNDIIDGIVQYCTFQNMKKNPMTNPDTLMTIINESFSRMMGPGQDISSEHAEEQLVPNLSFMRKGKVGNWKEHVTVAQNETFNAHIEEKLAGSDLTFEYEL